MVTEYPDTVLAKGTEKCQTKLSTNMNYDIAIIGGGPAGYTAAERAAEGGLKTVLFEKNAIGGVCLYSHKNIIILCQDIRQFQNILQIWHFIGRDAVFRHG